METGVTKTQRHHDFLDLSKSFAYLEVQSNVRHGNMKAGGSACDQLILQQSCTFLHHHEGEETPSTSKTKTLDPSILCSTQAQSNLPMLIWELILQASMRCTGKG